MLRDLQSFISNVNAQNKASVQVKRGTFVQINEATKTFGLPTQVTDIFLADSDVTVTKASAMGEPYSDYDKEQDTIVVNEFAGLISLQVGVRKATSEYLTTDTDAKVIGNYLTVSTTVDANQGKLIYSPLNAVTNIKSLGEITDNFSVLLGFRIV